MEGDAKNLVISPTPSNVLVLKIFEQIGNIPYEKLGYSKEM